MKRAAMLFPGQGSQFVGMGRDLVTAYPRAKRIYEEADEVLGIRLSRLSFSGDPDMLTETRNAQPAILLHSLAVTAVLRDEAGLVPSMTAGHSLGEYSALAAAGVLDGMDALRIVRRRGELMFEAGLRQPGTMAAVMGLDLEAAEGICREATEGDTVAVVANINSPGQIVISGHIEAVGRGMELARGAGARKVVPLKVSGAFHSPLVAPAQRELVEYMNDFDFHDARIGVVCNADAKVIRSKEEIKDALSRQLTSPVRWSDSMSVMLGAWEGDFVEAGPGNVLTGLLRRIDRDRKVDALGTAEALQKFIAPEVEFA